MKLKPCPFCGCNDQHVVDWLIEKFDAGHVARIHCQKCLAHGPGKYSEVSQDDATRQASKAWNNRHVNWFFEDDDG